MDFSLKKIMAFFLFMWLTLVNGVVCSMEQDPLDPSVASCKLWDAVLVPETDEEVRQSLVKRALMSDSPLLHRVMNDKSVTGLDCPVKANDLGKDCFKLGRMLFCYGGDEVHELITMQYRKGMTPFHMAVKRCFQYSIAFDLWFHFFMLIIACGEPDHVRRALDMQDNHGKTPLDYIIEEFIDATELLYCPNRLRCARIALCCIRLVCSFGGTLSEYAESKLKKARGSLDRGEYDFVRRSPNLPIRPLFDNVQCLFRCFKERTPEERMAVEDEIVELRELLLREGPSAEFDVDEVKGVLAHVLYPWERDGGEIGDCVLLRWFECEERSSQETFEESDYAAL